MIERRGLGHAFSFVKDLLKERSLNELFILLNTTATSPRFLAKHLPYGKAAIRRSSRKIFFLSALF